MIPSYLYFFSDVHTYYAETATLTTIGDRVVEITSRGENTYANGVLIRGGITLAGGRGSVLFLDQVLWVDHDLVDDLNAKYRYGNDTKSKQAQCTFPPRHLETSPPITSPWNNSKFLSHSLSILEKFPQASIFIDLMNNTSSLGDFASNTENKVYSLLVPTDVAFSSLSYVSLLKVTLERACILISLQYAVSFRRSTEGSS